MIFRWEYRWQVLFVVMIGTFMAALDSSIVNISIPSMMGSLHASVEQIEWVITSYLIGFAVFMPLTAWSKERLGQKKLYIVSLFIFTLGSLLCGISHNLNFLIFSRVVQALGGGALTPSAMAMVSKVFKPEERGRALGLWGLGVVMGPAIGPTLGGYLTHLFGWRSIFLVNIPIGIIGIYLSVKIIQELKENLTKSALDWIGFVMLSLFLTMFLYGVSQIENDHFDIYLVLSLVAASTLFLIIFIIYELKKENPLLDLGLFRIAAYSACTLITVSRTAALYGGLFLLPILLQSILTYSEIDVGLFMLPGSLIVAAMMPFAGRWSDRHGPRGVSSLGLIILTVSMFLFGMINGKASPSFIYLANIVRGIGLGFLVTPIATTAVNVVPYNRITMASSMLNLLQQVGGATGVAMIATFYQFRFNHYVHIQQASHIAQLKAIQEAFFVAGAFVAITLVPAIWLPKNSIDLKLGVKERSEVEVITEI